MKAKRKRQRVKVKDGVTIGAVSFLPFTFFLSFILPILSIPL
jgi:hypothetical protein